MRTVPTYGVPGPCNGGGEGSSLVTGGAGVGLGPPQVRCLLPGPRTLRLCHRDNGDAIQRCTHSAFNKLSAVSVLHILNVYSF